MPCVSADFVATQIALLFQTIVALRFNPKAILTVLISVPTTPIAVV